MEIDVLRWLAIVEANAILFVAAKTIYNYFLASKREFKKGEWKGILPMHVYLITTSYCAFIGSSLYLHIKNIGEPITVHFVLSMIGYQLGLTALFLILRYEERRVKYGRMQDDTETEILRQTLERVLAEDNLISSENLEGKIMQDRRQDDTPGMRSSKDDK